MLETRRTWAIYAIALAIAVAALSLGGCSGRQDVRERQPTPPQDGRETTEPAGPAALGDIGIALETVADGLDAPLYLTHAGDGSGRLFVLEQDGRIRVIENGRLVERAYLDITDRVSSGGERGLLGLAFTDDFEESGRFYVNYTDRSGDTIVARFTADDPASDAPRVRGPQTVLKVKQPYANHNGGCIKFGPDGYLYIGMGDGGSGGDPQNNAQNPKRLLGKMLRIDVESGGSGDKPYAIPEGNPFADGDGAPEVWMTGLRNPWRFSFDRKTGAMWIADVGQNAIEEIDVAEPRVGGQNWGWNAFEGTLDYEGGSGRDGEFKMPVAEYPRDEGQSVTGGYVYRGTQYPQLDGVYLYADFAAGWIAGMRSEEATAAEPGRAPTRRLLDDVGSPASFGEDEDGELYLVDLGGKVFRITAER